LIATRARITWAGRSFYYQSGFWNKPWARKCIASAASGECTTRAKFVALLHLQFNPPKAIF
jgi:hypothetical protein